MYPSCWCRSSGDIRRRLAIGLMTHAVMSDGASLRRYDYQVLTTYGVVCLLHWR